MHANVKKLIPAFLCLLLSVWMGAGVCVSENDASALALNERLHASSGETRITVSTSVQGNYILSAFSSEPVSCTALIGETPLAEGLLPLSVSLPKDIPVTLELSCEGEYTFEVTRASRGRNAYSPIPLTEKMDRTITRAHDVHYYTYTCERDETVLIKAQSAVKKGVTPSMLILTPEGSVHSQTIRNSNSSGAVVNLKKGESCLIRVWAEGSATGAYTLSCRKRTDASPVLNKAHFPESIHLVTGEWAPVSPDAGQFLLLSEDESVLRVTAEGDASAAGEGEALLYLFDLYGNSVSIPVSVSRAAVTGVAFQEDEIILHPGELIYPACSVLPPYAGNQTLIFSCSDESVAVIDESGTITGIRPGSCRITVTTQEGGFTDTAVVTVREPEPVYRALVVGIATYENERERTGCVNTTQGMADALSRPDMENGYLTTMKLDLSKEELINAIRTTFAGASEDDVSLFYINCHGGVTAGVAWLEMRYGSKMSAMELEGHLRKIPGTVVVIIDCCMSGAFIGPESGETAFVSSMLSQFTGAQAGKNAFASSKYKLLLSSSASQNSYRMASSSPATEQNMSTVFARSLTDGIGWNLSKDKKGTLKADIDNNRQISLHEAWLYTLKKSMSYLHESTARQTVQVWPRGDAFVLIR